MNKPAVLNEITFRDFISIIFRQKTTIVISFCCIMIIAFIGIQMQTPLYEASVKMHIRGIGGVEASTYQSIGYFRVHITQMEIVKSEPVLRRTIEALNLHKRPLDYEKNFCHPMKRYLIDYRANKLEKIMAGMSEENREKFLFWRAQQTLNENLRTELIPHSDIIRIIVADISPEGAVAIANVISRTYSIVDQEQQLAELKQKYGDYHPVVQQLRDNITQMTQRLTGDKLPDLEAIGTASVKVIEQAMTDFEPIGKPKIIILIIALFVSIFVGLALAFIFDHLNQTFRTPQEIITFLNLPILGTVPEKKRKLLRHGTDQDVMVTQFNEELADQIFVFIKTLNLKSILITSVMKGEGCSNIVFSIGNYLSQQMQCNILLVDANFRYPSLHKKYDLQNGPGLINILERFVHNSDASHKDKNRSDENIPTENKDGNTGELNKFIDTSTSLFEDNIHKINSSLSILTAGKTSDTSINLLDENCMNNLLAYSKERFDTVIIDCSNLRNNKDAGKIATLVDGVTVVISEGKVRSHFTEDEEYQCVWGDIEQQDIPDPGDFI
ncbi:MAG: hypothetical protein MUC95_09260 [Spirochaetes bacterium]|nr:hypothetical protein [Spirochaetota bacterium]